MESAAYSDYFISLYIPMTTSTYIPTSEFSSWYANTAWPDDAWTAWQYALIWIIAICVRFIRRAITKPKKHWWIDDTCYEVETKDPTTGKYTKTKKKF